MLMPIPRQVAVALLLVAAGFSSAQERSDTRVHRENAGTLDADGWIMAESTEGRFAVRLPCQFNDFTINTPEQELPTTGAFLLGCLRQDKRKFLASQMAFKAGAEAARQSFEFNSKGLLMPRLTTRRQSSFEGYRVVDFEIRNASYCGFIRYVLVEPTEIVMHVEAPPAHCDSLSLDAQIFFSSLKIRP
jgi:hypothetical protein